MTTKIRHSAIALAIFALSQTAQAGYTVMDDDLFPTNAIPASAAPRYNPPPTTYQNDRGETYSVLFRKNIWGLSDEGKKTIMDLLPAMHGNQILITGRPDANPNQPLAEQRSNWLRAWLIQQGIPPSQIETDTKNTANNAIGNQYPVEIRIIGNRSAPTPVAPTQTFRPAITQSTIPAPTTALPDNRIATVRQIAQTAQAGRIDAKDAIIMIAELLGATPLTPLTAAATPKPPTITVAPTPAPPPKPEFILVATAETSRPKEWALSANKTLKDNVVAWAKTENYTVDWRAANYFQVGRASTLAGELLDSVDKVRTVAGLDMSVWKKDRLICIGDTQNPCTKKN